MKLIVAKNLEVCGYVIRRPDVMENAASPMTGSSLRQRPAFGGRRWWLKCPQCPRTGRRLAKLYLRSVAGERPLFAYLGRQADVGDCTGCVRVGDRQTRCSKFRLSIASHNKPGQSQPDEPSPQRRTTLLHAEGRQSELPARGILALIPTNGEALLDAARELVPAIAGARDDIDRERSLPSSLADAMRNAQLFELWLPKTFGGPELHPIDFLRVVEELSRADARLDGVRRCMACTACWRAV
jgi:Acyl-CoA dehydrogenase, N-terminal domain